MLKSDPLFYLMKVGQYQSLTLAAENLHITQPALSIAIKNLEKELNLQLITRTRTGVILTKEAEKIVELAEKAFFYFNEIEEFVQQITLNKPIDISLYSTTPLNTLLIPALIKNYYQRYPEGNFQLSALADATPEEILLQHPDAFVITICNETKTFADQIGVSILDKSKTYLALSNTATFVPPDVNSISIKELLHIPLITSVASQEQNFQNEILKILHKHGALNIGFSAPGPELIDSLVVQNLGGTPYLKFKYFSNPAHYRFISIKNMPKFVLVLLYNKAIPQEKLDFILTLIEQIKR